MTPFSCAEATAAYIRRVVESYEVNERYEPSGLTTRPVPLDQVELPMRRPIKVYVGYLPIAETRKEILDLCPSVAVHPYEVDDRVEESIVSLNILCTTYDEDKKVGCHGLYHLLETIRFHLLRAQFIDKKYYIVPGSIATIIPDEQPYPQWLGKISVNLNLPQPSREDGLHGGFYE